MKQSTVSSGEDSQQGEWRPRQARKFSYAEDINMETIGKKPKNLIRINVNGRVFVLSRSTCIRIPLLQGLLTRPKRDAKKSRGANLDVFASVVIRTVKAAKQSKDPEDELFFERNPTIFAAIVDYVQSNELHVPPHVCPKLFARDLSFWGFDLDEVNPCCFSGVVHFLWEQEKLNEFHCCLQKKSPNNLVIPEGEEMLSVCGKMRREIWRVLEQPFTSIVGKIYFYILCCVILTSYFTVAAGTIDYFQVNVTRDGVTTTRDKGYIVIMEHACNAFLYLDYLLRFLFCPSFRQFFCELINITDGLAVFSSIAKTIIQEAVQDPDHKKSWLEAVDLLQLLRIIRLLRPMSKVTKFQLIYFTLKCSFHELMLVVMLLIFMTMICSSILYYLGDKESMKSIPHAMWYSLTTMTTVGYGDIVPEKARTKFLGCVLAVFGVILMSMTMPIMVTNFNSLYINAVVGQPSSIARAHEILQESKRHRISSRNMSEERSSGGDEADDETSDTNSTSGQKLRGRKSSQKIFSPSVESVNQQAKVH